MPEQEALPSEPDLGRKIAIRRRRLKESASYRKLYLHSFTMLFRVLEIDAGKRVFDVGCGEGIELSELANLGAQCIGLETSEKACTIIRTNVTYLKLPVDPTLGDACSLPYADVSINAVTSSSFFEHIFDPDRAIAEQVRVLKPGGVLLIRDGNLLDPIATFDILFFYSLRTKGRHGGLKWLFNRGRVIEDLYDGAFTGRDEDRKTIWWWRKKLGG